MDQMYLGNTYYLCYNYYYSYGFTNSTNSVKVNGIMYKTKAVSATKPAIDYEEPSFGQIREIYVVNSSVYFYVQALDTLDYSEHYCVYITAKTLTYNLVPLQSVASYLPLSPYTFTACSLSDRPLLSSCSLNF